MAGQVEYVPEPRFSELRRAVLGASIGNLIEWFDYAAYGYLAATIAAVFFAPGNRTAAFIATFLISLTGNDFAPGYYLMAAAVVAFIALLFTKEIARQSLQQE